MLADRRAQPDRIDVTDETQQMQQAYAYARARGGAGKAALGSIAD